MKLAYTVATPDTRDSNMLALRGDLEQNLRVLASLGYEGAELMVRDTSELSAPKIRSLVEALGLQIPALSTGQMAKEDGLSLSSLDAHLRQSSVVRTCRVIEFAAELDAQVNIGSLRGNLPSGEDREIARDAASDSLQTILARAAVLGVRLAIEPQGRYFINWINSVPEALERIEPFPAQLGILFDVYHAMLEERSSYASLTRSQPVLTWVHISDSNRMPPGSGHLQLGELIRVLHALGYAGFVSVECSPSPDGPTAARIARHYLRPYIDEGTPNIQTERVLRRAK